MYPVLWLIVSADAVQTAFITTFVVRGAESKVAVGTTDVVVLFPFDWRIAFVPYFDIPVTLSTAIPPPVSEPGLELENIVGDASEISASRTYALQPEPVFHEAVCPTISEYVPDLLSDGADHVVSSAWNCTMTIKSPTAGVAVTVLAPAVVLIVSPSLATRAFSSMASAQ